MRRIPLWLKIGWTAWVAGWAPAYAIYRGPENFLWFCDLALFAIAAGLWLESSLILSWQAVSVLVVQVLFILDVAGRCLLGFHPIGGTEFIFSPVDPLEIRLLSVSLHVLTPPVLLWSVWKLGYDRRALPFQIAAAAVVLAVSYFGGPDRNLNWSWGPLFRAQEIVAPAVYLAVAVVGYTILLYLPAHFFFLRIWPRRAPEAARKPDPPDTNSC